MIEDVGLLELPWESVGVESTENASVNVPTTFPTVNIILIVPVTLWATILFTAVADSQDVDSHVVWPERALPVYDAMPMPAPCTVKYADPVPA